MGRHVLIELAHLIAGLGAVAGLTWAAAWSYPLGRAPIELIGGIVAVAVVLWSIPGFRAAARKDRGHG